MTLIVIIAAVWMLAGLFANDKAGLWMLLHALGLAVGGPVSHFLTRGIVYLHITSVANKLVGSGHVRDIEGMYVLTEVLSSLIEQIAKDKGCTTQDVRSAILSYPQKAQADAE